jgi:hypothetical protein
MTVTFSPEITQDFILKHISEEEIFEAFGVPVVDKSFCSPLRTDKFPTCRFYRRRSNNKLIMRDFTGHFWGDCFDLVQLVTRKGYYDSLREIAIRFNLVDGTVSQIVRVPAKPKVIIHALECEIRVKRMEWTPKHLAYWQQYHISKETLDFFRIAPLEQAWLNGESVFWYGSKREVAFCYYFGAYDYKLYFPTRPRTETRFIHNNPNVLQGWAQLPEKHECIVVTKSLKDVMALFELEIPAIAPMSENQIISELIRDELQVRFGQLFSLYDTDRTGIRSMQNMKKMGIQPLFFKRSQPKDFADFLKMYGKEDAALVVDNIKSLFI